MDARTIKLAVVGTLILGSIATLAYISLKGNMVYAITVAQYYDDAERYKASGLRVEGELKENTHRQEQTPDGVRHSFTIRDKEDKDLQLDVVFVGPVPDTMREEGDMTVEGRLDEGGTLVASKVTPQCASKYEETLEEAYTESKTYEAVSVGN